MRGRRMLGLPVVITCYWTSYSGLRTILAPHLSLEGTSTAALAAILAVSALPSFLFAIPAGSVAERIGFGRVVLAGSAVIGACSLVLVVTSSSPVLVLSQTAMGFGTLMVWLGLQGLMVSGTAAAKRDGSALIQLSLYMSLGQLLGPMVGNLLAGQLDYQAALIGMCVVALVGLLGSFGLVALGRAAPRPEEVEQVAATASFRVAGQLFASRRFASTIVISYASLLMLDVKSAFQPLYYQHLGYSPNVTALILTTNGVAALASRVTMPLMLRRFAPETLTLLVVPASVLATGCVFLIDDLPVLLVLAVISGTGLGMAQTLTLQLLGFLTTEGHQGIGIGVRMVANRAAQWTSPAIFGAALAVSGLSGGFVVATGLATILTVPTSWYLHSRPHLSAAPAQAPGP